MKKLLGIIALVLVVSILIAGYTLTRSPQEPPQVKITIGDKKIDYIIGINYWNGAVYDRNDTFKTILKKHSKSEIPYIEIGEIVTIRFTNNPPSKITILDILIDEKGNQLFSDKEIINIPIELKSGKCSFKIDKHFASALSSYYVEGKTDIRGFRMIASWGGKWQNECEYGFIIRTDAF